MLRSYTVLDPNVPKKVDMYGDMYDYFVHLWIQDLNVIRPTRLDRIMALQDAEFKIMANRVIEVEYNDPDVYDVNESDSEYSEYESDSRSLSIR